VLRFGSAAAMMCPTAVGPADAGVPPMGWGDAPRLHRPF
jgi:hypothetical protein